VKRSYPYLKDPRAIAEIRKHQWIESEKAGREIGFGSAAIDWVSKYGQQWESGHAKIDKNVFIENRKYRRFPLLSSAVLIQAEKTIIIRTLNINPQGILCISKERLDVNSKVILQWSFERDRESGVVFSGTVLRVLACHDKTSEFKLLIQFDEESRRKIESCHYLLQ